MAKGAINWSEIEREYRAGQLTIREIARVYSDIAREDGGKTVSESAIRKKAKQQGWERNLVKRVNERVQGELVRSEARTLHAHEDDEALEDEAIKVAAARTIEIITKHRKSIGKLNQIVELASNALYQIMTGELVPETIKLKKNGKETGETKQVFTKLTHIIGPFDTVPEAVQKLASAVERLVRLERQAYGLDVEGGGEAADSVPLEERLKTYNEETKEQAIEDGENVERFPAAGGAD